MAMKVKQSPMAPYMSLMQGMNREQKLAVVAFLVDSMQDEEEEAQLRTSDEEEEVRQRTSDEEFVKELMRIGKLRERFTVLPLPEEADGYGRIKMALYKKGKPVDEFDMLIGGHALTAGLTVVTDNVKHFELMPGVKVENWMKRPE